MDRSFLSALVTSALFLAIAANQTLAQGPQPTATPVDPDATTAARALLLEIDSLSGHATLSGQHNFPNSVSRYSDRVYDLTGKYPGLFGQDLGFSSDPDKNLTLGRASLVEEVTRQYRAGAVIALTWHAVRPTDEEPVTFHGSVQAHLTDWEWKQLLTPGTDLYLRWCRQADLVAGYLRELQDAGVPVLFRPYHEMNGDWFWWGNRTGPEGSAALYRQLYDRFVHLHHLHNLVWVWNVNSPNDHAAPIDAYYPGPGYADVISMDIYSSFEQKYYDSMVALAGPNHPIALAEVGTMPTLDILARQPRWTYFMVWSGFEESANTPEQLASIYHASNVIDRGDSRLPAPQPTPAAAPLPVTQGADAAAIALLARLYNTRPDSILSGQQLAYTDADSAPNTSGKRPAIVELTVNASDTKQLLPAIRRAAKANQIVLLRWTPPRPTDGASTGPLTDFEWQQLLKPGTDLNARWSAQTNTAAALLKQIQAEHIAVLWSPYPEPNAQASWWAGRPGAEGSAALLRMLYETLTRQHALHNLVWLWEPASPSSNAGENGQLFDFYPGSLYADALELDVDAPLSARSRSDRTLQSFGGIKPIGVRVLNAIPESTILDNQTGWHWIILPPANAASTQPLHDFYNNPRVVSIPSANAPAAN
jgi:mannan endo-1,4-beta-mannosidase